MKKYKLTDLETKKEYNLQDFDFTPGKRFVVKVNVENVPLLGIEDHMQKVLKIVSDWAGPANRERFLVIPVRKSEDFQIFEVDLKGPKVQCSACSSRDVALGTIAGGELCLVNDERDDCGESGDFCNERKT